MSITLVEVNSDEDSNVLSINNKVNPNYILLELYYRVFLYNTKEAGKLV